MNTRLLFLSAGAFIALLSSCTTATSRAQLAEAKAIVGKTVRLKRPCLLGTTSGGLYTFSHSNCLAPIPSSMTKAHASLHRESPVLPAGSRLLVTGCHSGLAEAVFAHTLDIALLPINWACAPAPTQLALIDLKPLSRTASIPSVVRLPIEVECDHHGPLKGHLWEVEP